MTNIEERTPQGYIKYGVWRPGSQLEAVRVVIDLHPNRYACLGGGRDRYYNQHCYMSSKDFVSRAEVDARLLEDKLPQLVAVLDDFSADMQIHVEEDWLLQPGGEIPDNA
jgi:hypothetical protein